MANVGLLSGISMDGAHAYDLIAASYDALYDEPHAHAENIALFCRLLTWLFPGGDRSQTWLDAGYGTGFLLEYASMAPEHYLGIDASPRMLAQAQQKFPTHRFLEMNMDDLSRLPDASYDGVISLFGAFCYVPRPSHTLLEFFRLLRPGGLLILMLYTARRLSHPAYTLTRFHLSADVQSYRPREARALFSPLFHRQLLRGWHVDLNGFTQKIPHRLRSCYLYLESFCLRWAPLMSYAHYLLVIGVK